MALSPSTRNLVRAARFADVRAAGCLAVAIEGYTLARSLPDSLRIGSKMGNGIVRPKFLYLPRAAP